MNFNAWHYESDGETWARTHYLTRSDDRAPLGTDRIDFKTRATALKAKEILNRNKQLSQLEAFTLL